MVRHSQAARKQPTPTRPLHQLARLYGVQLAYYDIIARRRRQASEESLLAVLRALGAPVESLTDAPAALREQKQAVWRRLAEPVVVVSGKKAGLDLRLPAAEANGHLACFLTMENGAGLRWTSKLSRLHTVRTAAVERACYQVRRVALPDPLPFGYHRLRLETGSRTAEILLVATPSEAYAPEEGPASHTWGIFLPLHALHTQRSWGSGDFTDLEALAEWVSRRGGGVVATLPFLASFLDEPFQPSPYVPVSRLFWNEFFLDVTRVPELAQSLLAQGLLASSAVQKELESLRAAPLVDYRRSMALKRRILVVLARTLSEAGGERLSAFQHFVRSHPLLQDYARFRAVCERQRAPWPTWPSRLQEGAIQESDYDQEAQRYHLYVQWLAHEQLHAFAQKARQRGPGLYLDLPLGVHPDGFDVWRHRKLFGQGVSGGAPPDRFFTKGQDWGFPPLHPESLREQGYSYFIACLRHHLQYAGILRIDHVMGLHRLFWVPRGMKATEGVYVHYPAEEFYGILALESQRHRALIVGEDLGTVPAYVRPAMKRHKVQGIYVVQYELRPRPQRALRPIPRNSLASLNTHDMPTFAGFWEGLDIEDRVQMGLLREKEARAEYKKRTRLKKALVAFLKRQGCLSRRSSGPLAVLQACVGYLRASRSRVVTLNLEDLWGERHPQNVPGTTQEHLNWCRKAQYSFEEFCQLRGVVETLEKVNATPQRRNSR